MQSAFMQLIQPTLRIGLLNDIAIAPIVYPNVTEASFEAYAYRLFKRDKGYPPGYGNSSIGFGIYAQDPRTKKYYHDTTGKTNFSTYDILIPNFECSTCLEMFNLHSDLSRAVALDYLIESFALGYRNYSAVTGFTTINTSPNETTASVMFFPIAPSQNLTLLVGFIKVSQSWREVLAKSMPVGVKGVDIVVSDSHSEISFTAHGDTSVLFTGIGNLHDSQYKSFARTFPTFYNPGYGDYSISFYPNRSFFPANTNVLPIVACIGVIIFLLLIEILFGAYGHYLERQLQQKQEALDSKRSFVRFISHEIRTPLNTVCMGLKVLQEEAQAAVDVKVLASLLKAQDNYELVGEVASPSDSFQKTERAKAESMLMALLGEHKKRQELLKDIEESSNNAVDVLNELISYDKIEMQTLHIERELLPVWSLISSSVKPFYIQAREKGLQMQLVMDGGHSDADAEEGTSSMHCLDNAFPGVAEDKMQQVEKLHVLGDPMRLAQVFRNVISNALKFSYPGTAVSIRAVWRPDRFLDEGVKSISSFVHSEHLEAAGSVQISVTDGGPGLTAENLQHLFKEGIQFNANKLQAGGGSGLGLFISKGIVNMHNGRISASSAGVNKGATFVVELPVVQTAGNDHLLVDVHEADRDGEQKSESSASSVHPSTAIYSCGLSISQILVVDDSSSNRRMLCRLLSNCGCQCVEAEDGRKCLELMRTIGSMTPLDSAVTSIQLILMDYEMPVMKGPATIQELRKMGLKQVIIGVTGNVLQEDVDHFMRSGADAVLSKPLSMDKLRATLKKLNCCSLGKECLM
mmetsp:Transcript_10356/g.14261  ORF Transcript_10356/g.14261 Transcript_10356/m.14261 type:complete len:804 (+) Transcript_10356:1774-4185(+)